MLLEFGRTGVVRYVYSKTKTEREIQKVDPPHSLVSRLSYQAARNRSRVAVLVAAAGAKDGAADAESGTEESER